MPEIKAVPGAKPGASPAAPATPATPATPAAPPPKKVEPIVAIKDAKTGAAIDRSGKSDQPKKK